MSPPNVTRYQTNFLGEVILLTWEIKILKNCILFDANMFSILGGNE